jgi:hypothetical protein
MENELALANREVGIVSPIVNIISHLLVGQKQKLAVDVYRYISLYSVHDPDLSLKLRNTEILTLYELPEVSHFKGWVDPSQREKSGS